MNGIVTVTLNPAIDVHYQAQKFNIDIDNIATERTVYAAGKGINVSRALHAVGISAEAFLLLGEENASEYLSLAECYNIPITSITTDGAVRYNVSINTPKSETRLCMKTYTIQPEVLPVFAARIASKLTPGMAVVFSGSLPAGINQLDFAKFVYSIYCAVPDLKIVLDCPSITMQAIDKLKPFLVKPNHKEAEYMIKKHYSHLSESEKKAMFNYEDLTISYKTLHAAREIALTCHCSHCVVSSSTGASYAKPSSLSSGFIPAPKLDAKDILSTVGAGDSMLAGILFDFVKQGATQENGYLPDSKYNLKEALKWGLAFGSAACLTKGTTPPVPEDIFRLYDMITQDEI